MPERLLSIDPSLTNSGWAMFSGGILSDCGCVPAPGRNMAERITRLACALGASGVTPDRIAIEFPQVYRDSRAEGDPNQLLPLAAIAGAVLGAFSFCPAKLIKPAEWKAQVPKEIMFRRVYKRLMIPETDRFLHHGFDPFGKGRSGDVLDAIGVGLFVLGRL